MYLLTGINFITLLNFSFNSHTFTINRFQSYTLNNKVAFMKVKHNVTYLIFGNFSDSKIFGFQVGEVEP